MLNDFKRTTRSTNGVQLQAPRSFHRSDLVAGIQACNVVNYTASSTTDEHGADVATFGVSDSLQSGIQSSFELSPVSGGTQSGHVARSSSADAGNDTFHCVERLAIPSAHKLFTEEQSLLNCHGVQSSTVLLAFTNVARPSNLRNSGSSLGDGPAVTEDLGVVHVAGSNDANSRRTNRTFFESIANSAPDVAVVDGGSSSSTNSTLHSQAGSGGSGSNKHDFIGALVQQQITGHDVSVRCNSQ